MQKRTRRVALLEGVIAGVLFGTAAIFIKLLGNVDTFAIAFWRLVVSCVVLTLILIIFKKSFSFSLVRKNFKDFVILGFFLALHFIFFIFAVKDTTILNATVLVNTTPVFSVLVSSFVFKLKPSRIAIFGLTISFIGISVIAFAEAGVAGLGANSESLSPSIKGDLEAVLAAFAESFYLNYGKRVRREMDILSIMLPVYLVTAFFVGIFSLPVTRTGLVLPTETANLPLILGLGILPTATAHTLYFSSLSNLKSFETATMALLEPIGATILGIAVFQEMPAPLFVLGALLILLGVFFVVHTKE